MKRTLVLVLIFSVLVLNPLTMITAGAGGSETSSGPEVLGSRATSGYRNFTETIQILTDLETSYPNVVKKYDLSQRYSHFNGTPKLTKYGNRLWAIKISDNPILEEKDEPAVLYLGLHHAREWSTVEALIYMAEHLAKNYNTNSSVKKMVDENEIWILPIVNPDGYIYSHEQDDINKSSGSGGWRKNRQETNGVPGFQYLGGTFGDGVDLNRNYGYQWGYDNSGSSPIKNDTLYRGPSPFSEVETQIVRDLSLDRQFKTAVSFHSHSEVILFPWAYKDADTPHHSVFMELGEEMSRHNGYVYGNPNHGVLYNVNGEFGDWIYSAVGTYGFTFELGTVFIPPPSQIQSICKANAEAAFIAAKYAADPYSLFESTLEGTVKDTRGNPIEGALITTSFMNDSFETTSDLDGKYMLRLPDSSYSVTAERDGYATSISAGVNVPNKSRGTLNIVLKDIVPPDITEVKTSLELTGDENQTIFNAGERVVIIVRDTEGDKDLSGYAVVNSTSQGYVSAEQPLSYSFAVNGYYAYWYTDGLNQSNDYRIDVVMTDYDGNINFNGSNDTGADLVVSLMDVTPPIIREVNSYINTLQSNAFELGTKVRVEVVEGFLEQGLSGTVHILEKELSYSSSVQDMLFDPDKNVYFWEWETTGLEPSDSYEVHTTLTDQWGNSDLDGLKAGPDLTITLSDTMAPYISNVNSMVGTDSDEIYDLGAKIKLMVFEYDNESGLTGYVQISSPDLPGHSPEQLELAFNSENNYYFTEWGTVTATPFIDYYIESYLLDKYNNSDSDGSEGYGPDLVITLEDFVPPVIGDVNAFKNSHFNSLEVQKTGGSGLEPQFSFEGGDVVRIVIEPEKFETDLSGHVNITSTHGNYELSNLQIKYDPIFEHYYTTWDTAGLMPADDYGFKSVLMDVYGNADRSGLNPEKWDLVLSVVDTTPPTVTAISIVSKSTGLAILDRVELGDELKIMVTVRSNELGLSGKIKVTSAANAYDSGFFETQYNASSTLYWCDFITTGLKIGEDYELETVFSDRYNNIDDDGLKTGPDYVFTIKDTTLPDTIVHLTGDEDSDKKGTINLDWEPAESNSTVMIYRSEEIIFSLNDSEFIATIRSGISDYQDEVGANGKTYYYVLVVIDENGNENRTINKGNSISVTVTKLETGESSNAAILIIAAVAAVLVVISTVFLLRNRTKKVDIGDKIIKPSDDDETPGKLEKDIQLAADELYKDDYK